jgi:hypothetical protein
MQMAQSMRQNPVPLGPRASTAPAAASNGAAITAGIQRDLQSMI